MSRNQRRLPRAHSPDADNQQLDCERRTGSTQKEDVEERIMHTDCSSKSGQRSVANTIQTIIIMLALSAGVFLAALDAVIVTTALPTIARDVSSSDAGFSWIGSSYLLATAVSVPFWGNISNIFGRKPALIVAQIVFVAGSTISALAGTLAVLVTGRAVQGFGAGGMMVLVNIVIGVLFDSRKRPLYLGMVGAAWGVASAVGPLIGGGWTEKVSWRWCFWMNLPITGCSILALFAVLPLDSPSTCLLKGLATIDWLGIVTFTGATLMLLVGLELGGVYYPWKSATVVSLVVLGVATFILFIVVEVKISRQPIMPAHIFTVISVVATYSATFFHGITFAGVAFFLPVYFQTVLRASPFESGVWLLATAVPLALCTICTGAIIRVLGRHVAVVRLAATLSVIAMGLFITLPPRRDWVRLIVFQAIAALGIAPNLQALLVAVQSEVGQEDMAAATTVFGFVRYASIAIGVVAGHVAFQSGLGGVLQTLADAGFADDTMLRLTDVFSRSILSINLDELDLTESEGNVLRHALVESLSRVWVLCCVAAGCETVSTAFI